MGQDHRHLEENAEKVADVVGAVFGKALGAVAALQQERVAASDFRQLRFQFASFAGKYQRRELGELLFDGLDPALIGIDRNLLDRLLPPAVGGPGVHRRHSPTS
jgi:hypothetical protein